MEIMPGIHWLKAGYANVFLCVEPEGLTLVDSGTPWQAKKILNYMGRIGEPPDRLKRILITHADLDHAGSAAALHRMTGATVIGGAQTVALMRRGRSSPHIQKPMGTLGNFFNRYAAVKDDAMQVAAVDQMLPMLGGLRLMTTPGHTPDHCAFYSAERGVVFTGDALGISDGTLALPPPIITDDVAAARESARQLLTLEAGAYLCGHGDPLIAPGRETLDRALENIASGASS